MATIPTKLDLAKGMARIGASVLRERLRPSAPTELSQVPSAPDTLTLDWLTAALCRDQPDARVVQCFVGAPNVGSTTRRQLVIDYNSNGDAAELPRRIFAKGSESFVSRLSTGLTGIAAAEAGFYRDLRPRLDVETPAAYHAAFDASTFASMILLEDVASTKGVTFADPTVTTITLDLARSQLDLLATCHGTFWASPDLDDLPWLRSALEVQETFNALIGFEARVMVGLKRAAAIVPAELTARKAEIYPLAMRALEVHSGLPQTLLHQDVHLRNWYVTPQGTMGLFDWQCVGRGLWAQDVSYAITAALKPEDRRAWERDLLTGYLAGLAAAGGEPPSFEVAWDSYRQQALHGLIYWLFTLGQGPLQPDMHPRPVCEANVQRMAAAVVELGSLDAF